jgi:hypothetical protein
LKDLRYKAIKCLHQTGGIDGLYDAFTLISNSQLSKEMGMNYNTLRKKINDVRLFTIKDILKMAELFEIEPVEVFHLARLDIKATKEKQNK